MPHDMSQCLEAYSIFNDGIDRRQNAKRARFNNPILHQIHYGAEDKDETCRSSLNDPNCDSDYWWVKVDIADDNEDSDSGLKEVEFIAEGQNMYGSDIIYR